MSARMGRPPLPPDAVKWRLVSVRVSATDHERIAWAAIQDGRGTVSNFVRDVVMTVVEMMEDEQRKADKGS